MYGKYGSMPILAFAQHVLSGERDATLPQDKARLEATLAKNSLNVQAHFCLATILQRQKKFPEALIEYEQATKNTWTLEAEAYQKYRNDCASAVSGQIEQKGKPLLALAIW